MNFLKSTFITFLTNISIFLISVLNTIIMSRLLGTAGKGIVGIGNNIITFSTLILGLGIEASNIYFLGNKKEKTDSILGTNLIIAIFSSVVMLIIFTLNKFFDFKIFGALGDPILILVFLTVPFALMKSFLINFLLGMQDVLSYNKLNLFDRIFTFILLVIGLSFFKTPFWAILPTLISTIIIVLIILNILLKKKKLHLKFDRKIFKPIIKYGLKNQLSNIVQLLNYRLDIFVITYFSTVSEVGIYSNAVALGETIWQVSGSISTIIYPLITNAKDKKSMKDFINRTTRITLYIGAVCCIILALISKPIILIMFGKDFLESAAALNWLLPGICFFSISKVLANYLAGIGKPEKNIVSSSVSCIFTVIFDFLLIPKIGIIGASIATTGSYVVSTIITLYYYTKLSGSKLKDIFVLRKDDIDLIIFVIKTKVLKIDSVNNK